MNHSTPGLPVHHQLPEFTQTRVHGVGDAIQPCHPLSSPSPPLFNLSQHHESALRIRWPKYWSFRFNISPSNEHPGLISFRMDWLDLLAVQGTLESSPTPQFKRKTVWSFLKKLKIELPWWEWRLPWWLSSEESTCRNCRKPEFDPWIGKILWRRAWKPTPVFLPRESHGQSSLVGYNPWDHRVGHDWSNLAQTHAELPYDSAIPL